MITTSYRRYFARERHVAWGKFAARRDDRATRRALLRAQLAPAAVYLAQWTNEWIVKSRERESFLITVIRHGKMNSSRTSIHPFCHTSRRDAPNVRERPRIRQCEGRLTVGRTHLPTYLPTLGSFPSPEARSVFNRRSNCAETVTWSKGEEVPGREEERKEEKSVRDNIERERERRKRNKHDGVAW